MNPNLLERFLLAAGIGAFSSCVGILVGRISYNNERKLKHLEGINNNLSNINDCLHKHLELNRE